MENDVDDGEASEKRSRSSEGNEEEELPSVKEEEEIASVKEEEDEEYEKGLVCL